MNERASQYRARGDAAASRRNGKDTSDCLQFLRAKIVMGREVDECPVEAEYEGIVRLTKVSRARCDRVEGGLDVRRRAADHLKDLARRGLLLERVGELAVARLQFLE